MSEHLTGPAFESAFDHDDAGTRIGSLLDRTWSEEWARYTPRTGDVRRRGVSLRRRRQVGAPVGVVGLVTVLAGGVVSMTGGPGSSGSSAAGQPGTGVGSTVTARHVGRIPEFNDDSYKPITGQAVRIGSGIIGTHMWSVKVAVFASAAELSKAWPSAGMDQFPENLPASGPVVVTMYCDPDRIVSLGVRGLPAQLPAIPDGKPSVVDPWYAANLGVVDAVVDSRVESLKITSGDTTTIYHTVDVKGFRFVTFPITGPGDVTRIVAYDKDGAVLDQKAGHFLPEGVFPYQLPPTDPRANEGAWR